MSVGAGGFRYPADGPFGEGKLPAHSANSSPLTPLSFLRRTARAHPRAVSVIDGNREFRWENTHRRVRALAAALRAAGVRPGDVVSVMLTNIPAMYEAHFAVPMCGGILNTLNVRLDANTLAYILVHAGAKCLICEDAFVGTMREAVRESGREIKTVVVGACPEDGWAELGEYEEFVAGGDPGAEFPDPADENMPISVNYTSGTTGRPKGVVYSYRGAYLIALCNALAWGMPRHARYLWTLPMFHCNGWCFPWTMAAISGASVCLRKVSAEAIADSLARRRPGHMCGAPIVLGMLLDALESSPQLSGRRMRFMVAAAPPPSAVLQRADELGVDVTHVYGLTETYGPAVVCEWKGEWDSLAAEERSDKRSRQGIPYLALEGLRVGDPETAAELPADGATMGEVLARGNAVMLGYLKDSAATEKAFAGGWFHTGDLGVMEPDNYLRLKDRSKDIIISGGENIASVDVENALHRHLAVAAAAVVGRPDDKWGEVPCAFVELKEGQQADAEEIIRHCRESLASYMCPRHVVFGPIPRTSTGKIQKYLLRKKVAGAE